VPGCGEAGVIGALCGVIGSLQALEVVKLVAGVGESLRGRLLTYDALTQRFQTFALAKNPTCPACGSAVPKPVAAPNSSVSPASNSMPDFDFPPEISVTDAKQRLEAQPHGVILIDVREPWETEICRVAGAENIPMRQIPERLGELPKDRHLLILCHHGSRSRNVMNFLRAHGFDAVTNVTGGIAAWAEEIEPTMQRY
jgi:adenylyltransferase/sulfurtransferase